VGIVNRDPSGFIRTEDTWVSPSVALELRSTEVDGQVCRGDILHRVGTRTKSDSWKTLFDYPNPAYLCMTVRGGIPADLLNLVGKMYNLCRV
jgi:hypothetical protein